MRRIDRNLNDVAILFTAFKKVFNIHKEYEILYTSDGKKNYFRTLGPLALLTRLATDENFWVEQLVAEDDISKDEAKNRWNVHRSLYKFNCDFEITDRSKNSYVASTTNELTFSNILRKNLAFLVAFDNIESANEAKKFWGFKFGHGKIHKLSGRWVENLEEYEADYNSLFFDFLIGSTYEDFEMPEFWENIRQSNHSLKLDFSKLPIDYSLFFTNDKLINDIESSIDSTKLILKNIRRQGGNQKSRKELKLLYAFNLGNDTKKEEHVDDLITDALNKYFVFVDHDGDESELQTEDKVIDFPKNLETKPTFKVYFGPPGTGKTHLAKSDANVTGSANYKIVQIHPSSSYEDIVEGIRPVTFLNGDLKYEVVDGPIKIMIRRSSGSFFNSLCSLKINQDRVEIGLPIGTSHRYSLANCNLAFEADKQHPDLEIKPQSDVIELSCEEFKKYFPKTFSKIPKDQNQGDIIYDRIKIKDHSWGKNQPYLLLMDEINRGNVASILGEMIYLISETDSSDDNKMSISLQYSHETISWPQNLSLIGTMNSTDISIDKIDQAIKRRFEFIEIAPDVKVITDLTFLFLPSTKKTIDGLFQELGAQVLPSKVFEELNHKIESVAPKKYGAFNAKDKLIGHSYFIKMARRLSEKLNKGDFSPDEKRKHANDHLESILINEVKPAMLNIFNGDRDQLESFIKNELSTWGELNQLIKQSAA